MRAGFRRVAAARIPRRSAMISFPAPVRGLVLNEPQALASPGAARVLKNWWPTVGGVRLRRGCQRRATIGGVGAALLPYDVGGTPKLFAANATGIYDVTAPADPLVAPSPAVGSLTGGDWSSTLFANAAGTTFLVAANGANAVRNFDGSSWSTPTITGVTSSTLSAVWTYQNRLFFVQKNTLDAWCLAVDAISGAASKIPLGGVFKRGGSLLFGASWSTDSGDGLNDVCLFVTTKGEIAVYSGSDPADPANWSLRGRYDMAEPLGKGAHFRIGGDVLIATVDGLIPVSAAVQRDRALMSLAALSRPIEPLWREMVKQRGYVTGWSVGRWASRNMVLIGIAGVNGDEPSAFACNVQTGAWALITGWDIRAICDFGDQLHFLTRAGLVQKADIGGSDDGAIYECAMILSHDPLGAPGAHKMAKAVRATFTALAPFVPKLSVMANYGETLGAAPSAHGGTIADTWDVGKWDVAKWDSGKAAFITTRWVSVAGLGWAHAPAIQVTCGSATEPDAELVSIELLYEAGTALA